MAYTSKVDDSKYKAAFPSRLRALMDENKCKPKELAEVLTVSQQAIGAYMRGETMPKLDHAQCIADYFNVSLDYLTGRSSATSREENIQLIENFTGLSENAIKMLNEYKKEPNLYHILDLLNNLILDQNSDNINTLSNIASAAVAICTLRDDPYTRTMQVQINLSGLQWTCQNDFMQFIDRYTKE